MPKPCDNIGVRHGSWGEEVASRYLRARGLEIIERNSRPCAADRRLEIDIVAYESRTDTLVFVEVKQHRDFSPYQRRLRSVNRRKLANMRRVCNNWRLRFGWQGGYRFDVLEVYGTPETGETHIDHIRSVPLFTARERQVAWT
ncbi:MAG: YraN family protein [Kiritimatiellae bacterium]|nr:YraN family protein [Kiritimatiellia bacterium]MBR4523224.1 YraN family protein [Kiritimatiellia bacterium]